MEPIGFYYTCDDAYCVDCARKIPWQGFESWDSPLAIFHTTESDTPTFCTNCHSLIPHALTSEGISYTKEMLRDALFMADEARHELYRAYSEYLN